MTTIPDTWAGNEAPKRIKKSRRHRVMKCVKCIRDRKKCTYGKKCLEHESEWENGMSCDRCSPNSVLRSACRRAAPKKGLSERHASPRRSNSRQELRLIFENSDMFSPGWSSFNSSSPAIQDYTQSGFSLSQLAEVAQQHSESTDTILSPAPDEVPPPAQMSSQASYEAELLYNYHPAPIAHVPEPNFISDNTGISTFPDNSVSPRHDEDIIKVENEYCQNLATQEVDYHSLKAKGGPNQEDPNEKLMGESFAEPEPSQPQEYSQNILVEHVSQSTIDYTPTRNSSVNTIRVHRIDILAKVSLGRLQDALFRTLGESRPCCNQQILSLIRTMDQISEELGSGMHPHDTDFRYQQDISTQAETQDTEPLGREYYAQTSQSTEIYFQDRQPYWNQYYKNDENDTESELTSHYGNRTSISMSAPLEVHVLRGGVGGPAMTWSPYDHGVTQVGFVEAAKCYVPNT